MSGFLSRRSVRSVFKYVVIEKLRHIASSSNCAAMLVEALRSYRLMEAESEKHTCGWCFGP